MLVLRQHRIDGYRTSQSVQDQARAAGNCCSLVKGRNAVLDVLGSSLRASGEAITHGVAPLSKGTTIACEARLVANHFPTRCIHQSYIDGVLAISLTERAHKCVSEVLGPGDIAIDATMGNGYDTLFLADRVGDHGKVYAFDIQSAALEITRRRLVNHGMDKQVALVLGGHENLLDFVPAHLSNRIKAVMFNLGYRPTGDKRIMTSPSTTLEALEAALKVLAISGRITVVAYTGHCGGLEEAEAIMTFGQSLSSHNFRINWEIPEIKGRNPPRLVMIEKIK